MNATRTLLLRHALLLVLLGGWDSRGIGLPHAVAAPVLWDKQRMLMVDGRPRFVLGMYENPADDRDLQDAVRSGFNLFQSPAEGAALDRLERHGAKAWVNLGGALDLGADTGVRAAQLTRIVKEVGKHPALLVWEGPDEILWNQWWVPLETVRAELRSMRDLAGSGGALGEWARHAQDCLDRGLYPEFQRSREAFWREAGRPCPHPEVRVDAVPERIGAVGEGITAGIEHVRRLDPNHVVWLNHAPRNALADLRFFNRAADMVGCDIYPAPANLDVGHSDLTDLSLGAVGAYTRRMRLAAPGKACAMVLQGFGWRDLRDNVTPSQRELGIGRPPGFGESRFMAYEAILHGANAILYWGTAYSKATGPDGTPVAGRPRLWHDLLRIGREIRALEPALLAKPVRAPVIRPAATFGSHESPGFVASLRRVGDDAVLLVANESPHGRRFAVERLPSWLNGRKLHRLGTGEEHEVRGGRFEDGIRATDVHVYATSRRFEAVGP